MFVATTIFLSFQIGFKHPPLSSFASWGWVGQVQSTGGCVKGCLHSFNTSATFKPSWPKYAVNFVHTQNLHPKRWILQSSKSGSPAQGALKPELFDYKPQHDLKEALQNRWALGFNTQDTSEPRRHWTKKDYPPNPPQQWAKRATEDVICSQVLEPLKDKLRVEQGWKYGG